MKVDSKVIIAGAAIVVVLAIIAVIGAACCACVFFAGTTTWHWGSWSTQTEHRTDTTVHAGAANIELYVDTFGGNVEIQQSAVESVTVTYDVFYPQGRMSDMQTGTRSENIGNDTVRITAEVKRNPGFLLTGNYGAHVTVLVPKNASYNLDLHTVGGNIRVPPLHGSSVVMDTTGGEISLNGGRYDSVTMNTIGGNVHATYEATNATFRTTGGNIELDTTQTSGTLYASTTGGNIRVSLPSQTLFTVDASTFGGRVRHSSIHMSPTTETDSQLVGPTEGGAGDLKITLKTMGGNIDISY